jgi:nicotinate phosphoribosyltransferase
MTQFASPVLHTLLDTDAYKLHMQQAVFHHYYDVHVAAEFRCRGDDCSVSTQIPFVNRSMLCSI